jgi:glutamate dehydrogenase (NADP+)
MGGSLGREAATAMGAFFIIEQMMGKLDRYPQETTVAVQGFGNAGGTIAELLSKVGYKVVAVSDSQGGIYAKQGLDIPSIRQYKNSSRGIQAFYCEGTVCNIMEHEVITNADLLTLDVDILIPAALENQITAANANQIQARYIFEVANGPITSEADAILDQKNILVFPDILINAGGVTVSYFEWVQNRSGLYWTLEEVNQRLQEKITAEANHIWSIAQELGTSLRNAAYIHALNRLGEAIDAKGTRDYYTSKR